MKKNKQKVILERNSKSGRVKNRYNYFKDYE